MSEIPSTHFAVLYQSLVGVGSDPGPDAQNLQHFPRCQIPEDEPANVLLFGRQFDRTTFDEKTPWLEEIDRRKEGTPTEWRPQRCWLKEELRHCNQRGDQGEQPQPRNVTIAVGQ